MKVSKIERQNESKKEWNKERMKESEMNWYRWCSIVNNVKNVWNNEIRMYKGDI